MGDPDPSKQGDEWLNRRLNSEHAWVRRYLNLPFQQQSTESLRKPYQRRINYITQIENEIKSRQDHRTFHDELASAGRVAARSVMAIMKTENVDMDEAALIFQKRSDEAEKQVQQEKLKREEDAKILKERFFALVQDYQSKGYTEEQSSNRANQQLEREKADREFQDALVAADNGDMNAQCKVAEIFDSRSKWEESVEYYWKAASQGHKKSINNLGQTRALHYDFLTDSQKKLLRVWKANEGEQFFQLSLGEEYFKDGDFELALSWFNKAASSKGGSTGQAQYYLAILYSEGKGVAKNDEMARDFFLKSAEQRYAPAQYRMGLLYQFGDGVPIDMELAYMWLSMSLTGSRLPRVPVDSMPSFSEALNARNSVAQSMSASQIESAKSQEEKMQRKTLGLL